MTIRRCDVDDAAALADMYVRDRAEIEEAEPGRTPAFFTEAGQRDRIGRVWAEEGVLGFVVHEGAELVGLLLLEPYEGVLTVGYYIASAWRRRGIATRALAELLEIAFGEMQLDSLVADIRPENSASLHVAASNGFRDVGPVVIEGVDHRRLVVDARR